VRQHQQLRLAVRAAPLPRRREPGPADLEAAVLEDDVHVAAAADRPARARLDRRERELRASLAVADRGVSPVAEVRLGLRPGDRPAPDCGVEADLGEPGDVVGTERLEADDPALERDGFDAGGDSHAAIVRHPPKASARGR
jgi:hypothetical protein